MRVPGIISSWSVVNVVVVVNLERGTLGGRVTVGFVFVDFVLVTRLCAPGERCLGNQFKDDDDAD